MYLYKYNYKLYYDNYDVEFTKTSRFANDKDFVTELLGQPWQGGYLDDGTYVCYNLNTCNKIEVIRKEKIE